MIPWCWVAFPPARGRPGSDSAKTVEKKPVPLDFERAELEHEMTGLGAKAFHGRQVFRWLWRNGTSDFESMTNLGRDLRARLVAHFSDEAPRVESRQTS